MPPPAELHVVLVVPFGMQTSLRFARAIAALPGVRCAVLSQEPREKLPPDLARRIDAHRQVADALDPDTIEGALRELAGGWKPARVDRLVGVLEQLQEPLAEVRERLSIRGMGVAEARNFRDKARMKDVLRAHGIPCARHGLATTAREARSVADRIGFPLVVKPPAGAGARGTARLASAEQLERALAATPPSAAEPLLLEEFVTGREHSFDSVSVGGRHVFHSISRYHPTPLEVMEQPWIQWVVVLPRDVSGPEYADIREAGWRALSALGMVTGLTHMEWFRRRDGSLAISEVAARPPGAQFTTLISYAHDRDFYAAWAELIVFERFDPPERRYACGAAFLRGQGSGKVLRVTGLEQARRELGELVVEVKVPPPGTAQASSYEGEGYVILRHPETEAVEAGLDRLLELIRVELGPA